MSTNIKDLENRLWEAARSYARQFFFTSQRICRAGLRFNFSQICQASKLSKTEKEIAEERKSKTKNHGGASVARERPDFFY